MWIELTLESWEPRITLNTEIINLIIPYYEDMSSKNAIGTKIYLEKSTGYSSCIVVKESYEEIKALIMETQKK